MMSRDKIIAELRLFSAYTLTDSDIVMGNSNLSAVIKGIVFDSNVTQDIQELAVEMYGLKPEEWNNTFHKSFQIVLDTPLEVLVAQQLIHYFTTYGLEELGIYNNDLVYVPHEKLEIPELDTDFKCKVIHKITEQELQNRLMNLLTSGIALSKQTIDDIMVLSDYIDKDEFDTIKNREIKIALYDKYGIVPKNNMEFLRYVVYKTTNSTLYIQSNDMIYTIKKANKVQPYEYFNNYILKKDGYKKLAEIFLRNKNIFLAFKTTEPKILAEKSLNSIINKISKLSSKYHKPVKQNILDSLSSIKTLKDIETNKDIILSELDNITIFREIRILNGLKYRLSASSVGNNVDSIVYRVRNGKAYATTFKQVEGVRQPRIMQVLINLIYNHLVKRLTPKFKDKTFYIPDNVLYVAPSSEKQFYGNIPEGSKIIVPRKDNMVIGVHWVNLANHRVDLDMKLLNKTEHYGWNAAYYSNSGDIVFSGDITSAPAPKGATEVFLISPKLSTKSFLLTLNDFTQCKEEIPFELFIASYPYDEYDKYYTLDPNCMEVLLHNKFDNTDKSKPTPTLTLGYVEITDNEISIQFKNFETIKGRVNKPDEVNKRVYEYTDLYSKVQLTFNELIKDCGGKIMNTNMVETMEEVAGYVTPDGRPMYTKVMKPVDFDLAVNNITKDTFITMLGE